MSPQDAQDLVAKSARGMVSRKVFEVTEQVRRGKQREFRNPFTEQMMSFPVSPEVKAMAEKIRSEGLHEDSEFMETLRKFTLNVAASPLFAFFSALDGEDAFDEEVQVELRLLGGERLPGTLHENLFPIDRDEDQPD